MFSTIPDHFPNHGAYLYYTTSLYSINLPCTQRERLFLLAENLIVTSLFEFLLLECDLSLIPKPWVKNWGLK
jgi:hypothetical protein